MARFHGEIGYAVNSETPLYSGVWVDHITEFTYQGDVVRINRHLQSMPYQTNDNITLNNAISIVADDFAVANFLNIKYVRWGGVLWTVTTVEVQYPRLILNLGSVYNGPTA